MSRIANRLLGIVQWARVVGSRAATGKIGRIWTKGPPEDELQHWQQYGFLSRPNAGADAIVIAVGSHADQRVAILVGDRRYTMSLKEGEVVVCDDLGQRIHLTRENGIVVTADDIRLGNSGASLGVARETDPVSLDFGPLSWAKKITAAINAVAPGTIIDELPTGTITSGSDTVKAVS